MENNTNPLIPGNITKNSSSLIDGKLNIIELSRDGISTKKIEVIQDYILIIPFDRTQDNSISNIYIKKYTDPVKDESISTMIMDIIDFNRDNTSYDAVGRVLLEEAGLNLEEEGLGEDEIFYIGPLSINDPIYSNVKCYAIDLTKINRPGENIDFTTNLSKFNFIKDSSDIIKVGFHQIVNGDYSDVFILGSTFLLISYFQ